MTHTEVPVVSPWERGVPASTVACSAPLRLSIAGGATDLPEYYLGRGTQLLVAGLSQRLRVSVSPRSDGELTLEDGCPSRRVADDRSLVAAILRRCRPAGADVRCECAISPGAGLGGSAALGTALVKALAEFDGTELGDFALAMTAFRIEREEFESRPGLQDHLAAVFAGLTRVVIDARGEVELRQEPELFERLRRMCQLGFLMLDTGIRRPAAAVLTGIATGLDRPGSAIVENATRIAGLTADFEAAIRSGDLAAFGASMHQHWLYKQELSRKTTNAFVDEAYAHARRLGAYGGKLAGAGGGGFLFLVCPPERRESIARGLEARGLRQQPIELCSDGIRLETPARLRATGSGP